MSAAEVISTSFFVKCVNRRPGPKARKNPMLMHLQPVWTFDTEQQAIDFGKTFETCWVQVVQNGKVLWQNFPKEKPKWMSLEQAEIVRKNNEALSGQAARYVKTDEPKTETKDRKRKTNN